VRPILDLYDELREILRFENLEFPKILVVGDQSAGKTSVLEAISKLNLPR
jgi:interferon-induced GTP-binding protein Mx1